MPDFIGPIRPKVAGAFKIVESGDLGGVFVKSVTAGGLVTQQDSSDAEETVQLAGGGASITVGTADPSGGSAGDAYIQVDGSDEVQSLWTNGAGTWAEYAVPGTGVSTGASITSGTADPTGGSAGDAYLQVDASDVLQSIWRNVSGTWTEYTLPSGVALSDTAPRSVSTGANAAGTATDAARRDHHHQVPAATTTVAGISERATDAETRTGTSTTRVLTPANLTAGLDNRASDDAPADPASTAAAGSSTDFSRSDHVHPAGTGEGADLSDELPVNIGPQSQHGDRGRGVSGRPHPLFAARQHSGVQRRFVGSQHPRCSGASLAAHPVLHQ